METAQQLIERITSTRIADFHTQALLDPAWPPAGEPIEHGQIWDLIVANHRCNSLLWNEEDLARRANVAPEEIVRNKRNIDRFNQARNDAIEGIDRIILEALAPVTLSPHAWLNSETAGSIIDRLSILALKVFHMDQQSRRHDTPQSRRMLAAQKLEDLTSQRRDLMYCLDHLLHAFSQGKAYFKIYRQHKMYNDPAFNPHLSADAGRE